jgi:TorA maturation chaperone TorD
MDVLATADRGRITRVRPRRTGTTGRAQESAFVLAALYRMLALSFSNPEPGLVHSIVRECGALKIALRRGALPSHLARALQDGDHAWRAATADELAVEYSRLFLGAGMAPLREGGFGDGLRFAGQPVDIADISGFYLAFGFRLPDAAANPPDHLGAELEFMSLLHLKMGLALQRGWRDQSRITRSAMGSFLKDHLGRWAGSFASILAANGAAPAYRTMGRLLARTVEADCAIRAVKPTKARLGASRDTVGGEELVCPFGSRAETASRMSNLLRAEHRDLS